MFLIYALNSEIKKIGKPVPKTEIKIIFSRLRESSLSHTNKRLDDIYTRATGATKLDWLGRWLGKSSITFESF